jgi:hypothetical protein
MQTKKRLLLFIAWLFLTFAGYGATLYVKHNATGANNGTSWANAYTDLQVALNAAAVNDKIWVVAGTYIPTQKPTGVTSLDNRLQTFYLNKNVKLYGGFVGTETQLSQRNPAVNITILSGNIGAVGDNTDNCYHVFVTVNLSYLAVIDGFTIKDGNSINRDETYVNYEGHTLESSFGAGFFNVVSSPTLTNMIVSGNTASENGGGFYNRAASPTLRDVTVLENTANFNGGGFYNSMEAAPTLKNVTVSGNTAFEGGGFYNWSYSSPILMNVIVVGNNAVWGGAFSNSGSSPVLTNVMIVGNNANYGSAFCNSSSSPILTNVTISENTASSLGGVFYDFSSAPVIYNSIIWNNENDSSSGSATYYYSLVGGSGGSNNWNSNYGYDGGNNLDVNPLFISTTNFSLQAGSPSVNAGNNTYNTTVIDLLGNPRIQGGTIDMGAYESSVGVAIEEFMEEPLWRIFPNPVCNVLIIENMKGFATIYNSLGQIVSQFEVTNTQYLLNTNNLPQGVYILQIKTANGQIVTKQFVK